MAWDGPGPEAKLPSREGMQMVARMVWPGHHLGSMTDAASGHRGCPELVNTEILSEEWEKQHGTHTVEEPKIYSKHHIRFMSNILLLIIRKHQW